MYHNLRSSFWEVNWLKSEAQRAVLLIKKGDSRCMLEEFKSQTAIQKVASAHHSLHPHHASYYAPLVSSPSHIHYMRDEFRYYDSHFHKFHQGKYYLNLSRASISSTRPSRDSSGNTLITASDYDYEVMSEDGSYQTIGNPMLTSVSVVPYSNAYGNVGRSFRLSSSSSNSHSCSIGSPGTVRSSHLSVRTLLPLLPLTKPNVVTTSSSSAGNLSIESTRVWYSAYLVKITILLTKTFYPQESSIRILIQIWNH